MSLRAKLTLFFLISCVCPVLILVTVSIRSYASDANAMISRNMRRVADSLAGGLNDGLKRLQSFTNLLYMDEAIIAPLEAARAAGRALSPLEQLELGEHISGLRYSTGLVGLERLIIRDSAGNDYHLMRNQNRSLLNSAYPMEELLADTAGRRGTLCYGGEYGLTDLLGGEVTLFGYARTLKNITRERSYPLETLGELAVFLNSDFFVRSQGLDKDAVGMALYDARGDEIWAYHPDASAARLAEALAYGARLESTEIGLYGDWALAAAEIGDMGHKAVYYMATGGGGRGAALDVIGVACVLLACAAVALVVVYRYLNRGVIRPLSRLAEGMRDVSRGLFGARVEHARHDEIGAIIDCFNGMSADMQALINRRLEAEQKLRHEEIRTLQSQLNPHFLYNTLGIIRLMAMERKQEDMALTLTYLGRFLRNTIRRLGSEITLREELAALDDYLAIQRVRYPERFEVEVTADEAAMELTLPSLTLQPLIENAIMHGVLPKKEKGLVTVSASTDVGVLRLTVLDRGVGMSPEAAEKLYQDHGDLERSERIGFYNVHRILQLRYGAEFGLEVESKLGEYTRVTAVIPACHEGSSPRWGSAV